MMQTNAIDLISVLCLDAKLSTSPYRSRHRVILITKDYSNAGDFVFNTLMQHFGKREPNSRILLVSLSHDWTNYSAAAARCGFNLRRTQNMGNIDVVPIMDIHLENVVKSSKDFNYCQHIFDAISENLGAGQSAKPLIVMIDDLSILLSLGAKVGDIGRMLHGIDTILEKRSEQLQTNQTSQLIIQSNFVLTPGLEQSFDEDLNYLIASLQNSSDINVIVKPLETGPSNKVDGTIQIVDNRIRRLADRVEDSSAQAPPSLTLGPIIANRSDCIGQRQKYFFKLGDRRVKLTTSVQ